MQLWVLDRNPYIAASMLTDKEIRKMLVEHLQLLSTFFIKCALYKREYFYKPIPQGKELVNWISNNLSWSILYLDALVNENIKRNKNANSYLSVNVAKKFLSDFPVKLKAPLKNISFRCKKEYPLYNKLNKQLLPIEDGIKEYLKYHKWNQEFKGIKYGL